MKKLNTYKTSPEEQILIVADAHLPLDNRIGAQYQRDKFMELLRAHQDSTQMYILLGDIFDFWYEWNLVIPKNAYPILTLFQDLIEQGKTIRYFSGNHDFRIKGMLESMIGLTIHDNDWRCVIDGRRTYLSHGDGKAVCDKKYRMLKILMRNKFIQEAFLKLVHPDFAMDLGRLVSQRGRKNNCIESKIPETEYLKTIRLIINNGYDLVIFGHTHGRRLLKLNDGWYHNPGAFLHLQEYSVIQGGLPETRVWK